MNIYYDKRGKCRNFWAWLFEWYWGVNKWGDREWGLRILGLTFENEVDV